jgi:hypothetical protein
MEEMQQITTMDETGGAFALDNRHDFTTSTAIDSKSSYYEGGVLGVDDSMFDEEQGLPTHSRHNNGKKNWNTVRKLSPGKRTQNSPQVPTMEDPRPDMPAPPRPNRRQIRTALAQLSREGTPIGNASGSITGTSKELSKLAYLVSSTDNRNSHNNDSSMKIDTTTTEIDTGYDIKYDDIYGDNERYGNDSERYTAPRNIVSRSNQHQLKMRMNDLSSPLSTTTSNSAFKSSSDNHRSSPGNALTNSSARNRARRRLEAVSGLSPVVSEAATIPSPPLRQNRRKLSPVVSEAATMRSPPLRQNQRKLSPVVSEAATMRSPPLRQNQRKLSPMVSEAATMPSPPLRQNQRKLSPVVSEAATMRSPPLRQNQRKRGEVLVLASSSRSDMRTTERIENGRHRLRRHQQPRDDTSNVIDGVQRMTINNTSGNNNSSGDRT